jgi:hypothetical protein
MHGKESATKEYNPLEYLVVRYHRRRKVMIKDKVVGFTNELIELEGGPYTIKLGLPPNYRPSSRRVDLQNTAPLAPKTVSFEPIE